MTDAARAVASALAQLCFRAGVSPADGSDEAAALVCGRLAAEGATGPAHCPVSCPLGAWLRRATGLTAVPPAPHDTVLLVGPEYVLVLAPKVNGRRVLRDKVPLPAALAAAVRRIAGRKESGLTEVA